MAVRLTDVPAAVPDGIEICASIWSDEAVTLVPISPMAQETFPSPEGHLPVKLGCAVDRVPVRATLTP